MTFGKVSVQEYNALTEKYFLLPTNEQSALKGTGNNDKSLYVGLPKWSNKSWNQKFKVKKKDHFTQYIKYFNWVELNATHYKLYDSKIIQKCNEAASGRQGFKFCLKFLQAIIFTLKYRVLIHGY